MPGYMHEPEVPQTILQSLFSLIFASSAHVRPDPRSKHTNRFVIECRGPSEPFRFFAL